MYADRHAGKRGINPVGLGASLTINAAIILALIYAAPNVIPFKDPLTTVDLIPIDPPPPPIPQPQPHPRAAQPAPAPQPTALKPPLDLPTTTTIDLPQLPPIDLGSLSGADAGAGPAATPSPLPALIGASIDPRYASDFQPAYPPAERRASREGRVVVRVLIGVDGRVKQIEKISATSDAFFAATEQRALTKWRFKPATRGDVPVEQWKQMSVSFVLKDD